MDVSRAPEAPSTDPHLVLGTAGHIDHGKTALVRALTGVDTDRLPQERARGITIELGFAPLDVEGLRLGVVDVPGHERLVRTMVAGAAGIDLALLVVAADEGVMPQTREHLAICELLEISRGVVALTKIDAAPDDVADLAEEELRDWLSDTPFTGAPIVRVSALRGDGLAALRTALAEVARGSPARTPRRGPPRLPVDRSFAAKGFGSVVTGTLVGGPLALGDPVEVQPGGARGRVRGLQRHGTACDAIAPGTRCAVNVQGVALEALRRGRVLTAPDALAPTRTLDVAVGWLPAAPPLEKPTSIELLVGAAARRARAAPIGPPVAAGRRGFARIHVEGEPVPALPGDRFVARGFAATSLGGATLGGGVILDVAPPHRRRSDPSLRRDLEALARREPQTDVDVRLRRAGLSGVEERTLARETGLDPRALEDALTALERAGHAIRTGRTCLADESIRELAGRMGSALDAHHAAEPLSPGMPVAALRGAVPANAPADAVERALARLAAEGELRVEGDLARRPAHRPRLDAEDAALAGRLRADARAAALEPPSLRDWEARLGVAPGRLRNLLGHLEREGALVRAPGDLWFDAAVVEALRERVVAHLREHGRLDTADYKALIGTSRRTAVPLMELFDAERLTVRRDGTRMLRSRGGRS